MTQHNNTGFDVKGSEDRPMATQITKNRLLGPPRYCLTPPLHGTPTNIRMSLILPKGRVPGLHFFPAGLSFVSNSVTSSEIHIICGVDCGTVV